jgi:TRAP-type mannitol/chloroaromatic compound transport system permease small subunit
MIALQRFADGASGVVRVIGQAAAWSGLALVLLVAFNVLARYLFSYGTVALQELEWHVMAVAALMGMSYGLNQGGEVRVDIIYAKMTRRQTATVDAVSNLALALVSLLIAWLCIGFVESAYSIGEGSPDPGGLENRWILKAVLPIAFAILALQALASCAVAVLDLLGSEKKPS